MKENLIGPKVQHFRKLRNWTQAQLAAELEKRGWSCTAEEIANIEESRAPVSDAQFLVLGYALGVDHVDLYPPHIAKDLL